MYIVHSELKKDYIDNTWQEKNLDKFGFIHCSDIDTYYLVAPNFKDENKERVLLVIDCNKLKSKLIYEDVQGVKFPHIYERVNEDAIVRVLKHSYDENNIWIKNKELDEYKKKTL